MQRIVFPMLGVVALAAATSGYIAARTWPPAGPAMPAAQVPALEMRDGRFILRAPADALLSTVATFTDELLAYLHFEHLRSRRQIDGDQVLLTAAETPDGPSYRIQLVLENDLLAAVPYLAELAAARLIAGWDLSVSPAAQIQDKRQQTLLFVSAYNFPVRTRLEELSDAHLMSPLVRFLLFKSKTDRRVRESIEPVPAVLSRDEAGKLAADVIAVARFYALPLDFFLGIGAMENNYMNATGDSEHAVWKRRPEKGDIVLRRRGGRVLVHNFSIGIWQITRETLRYAHRLYLADERDYTALPERLRPSKTLDLDAVEGPALTTYAGLLLRDLLDKFDGNVERATGAYNGGPRNPNLKYAAGVAAAAEHARRVMEQASVLSGRRVAETQFIMSRRGDGLTLRVKQPQPAPD
jgi:hypothetical protein